MPARRPARTTAVVALLLATAAGCGDTGGLRGAGSTPTAISPARLWPDLPPASSPGFDYDDGESELVRGVTAPGDDIHQVDPVAVVRAEIARHPAAYTGAEATYAETVRRLDACPEGASPETGTGTGTAPDTGTGMGTGTGTGTDASPASGTGTGTCPVLKPYYRDLTGDGRDDLTLGFRLLPGNQTAVRVYTFRAGRLMQVMSNDDAVTGVELAGRSVIIRSPSDIADYEYRFQWTWDPDQRTMLLTHDEMLRTGPGTGAGKRPGHRSASPGSPSVPAPPARPSSAPAPSVSPSASVR